MLFLLFFGGIFTISILVISVCIYSDDSEYLSNWWILAGHAVAAQVLGTMLSSYWCSAASGPNVLTALGGATLAAVAYVALALLAVVVVAPIVNACRRALKAGGVQSQENSAV